MSGGETGSQLTKGPAEALKFFAEEYRAGATLDKTFGVGEVPRAEAAVAMFLSVWSVRRGQEIDMENAAQYAWQRKAKDAVSALIGALKDEEADRILDKATETLRKLGHENPGEVLASLIR